MRNIYVFLILLFAQVSFAQTSFPQNGPADQRPNAFVISHATIWLDADNKIEDASIIIENGIIKAVGKNLTTPKNFKEINAKGKIIYPAFVDLYSSYGIKWEPKRENFRGQQFNSNKPGAYNWNEAIRAELNAVDYFMPDEKSAKNYKSAGFGISLSSIQDGICRGSASLVSTGSGNVQELIIKPQSAQAWSFNKGSSSQDYPGSMMGCIALIRQSFLDVMWYSKQNKEVDLSMEAFRKNLSLPLVFEAENKLAILRAAKIAKEFNQNNWIIKGSGDEYQRIKDIKAIGRPLIVPVNFPKPYEVEDPFDAELVSLGDLKHWELAPANLSFLQKEGITFCITMKGCESSGEFLKNLRKAIQYGLKPNEALRALTQTPARLIGASNVCGKLAAGMPAHFSIADKDLFTEEGRIEEIWSFGNQEILYKKNEKDINGNWTISGDKHFTQLNILENKGKQEWKLIGKDTQKVDADFSLDMYTLSWKDKSKKDSVTRAKIFFTEINQTLSANGFVFYVDGTQSTISLNRTQTESTKEEKDSLIKPNIAEIIYPFTDYGSSKIASDEEIIFKNASVWTNEKEGVLSEADVWIKAGKIVAVGKNLSSPTAKTIDAKGKHLTNGIIDEHSHLAIYRGVNECTQAITAEVRIGDVLNSEDLNIYRQLAGGVIGVQLLHGSCNPVGGQSAIIKLRWGKSPEELKIAGADGFIKFALGENVKQSNWGSAGSRYPQTRMGVEQVYVDAFTRAREYEKKMKLNPLLTRKDLELETLLEILNKKRFISCHSYVQSEINMLMHVADSFGFKVNTFTHILEGYKVADKMKAHGVSASTFADWWAYKYEVVEAIPYNGAILHNMGVTTAINSDDAEMGRRLNQEAAKMVKYGKLSEEAAWKMVTLNPAKMLHLDKFTGSIRAGKDADLVLWNDNPLSIYAKPEMTFVDGICYFSLEKDKELREYIKKERNRIIQLMIQAKNKGEKAVAHVTEQDEVYHCEDY
jgi:imidazolonepropionase-like amidohydrolase